MRSHYLILLTLLFIISCASQAPERLADKKTIGLLPTEKQPDLVEVVRFENVQPTGLTVTRDGRMFVSFPRWREDLPFSLLEILPDGTRRPYPNEEWNTWSGVPQRNHFTCVQSVVADKNHLYVLDPSSPELKGVVGRAKLYRFDLDTNDLEQVWEFSDEVAPSKSYLNDLRIDEGSGKIYITDSGLGGIVTLDTETGVAKRLLDKHPSTKSENVTLIVDKKEFDQKIHSDGIALSPVDDKLYYHALTAYTLYRVPSSALNPAAKDETQLVKQIERLGVTPAPDGMIFDREGNLYMGDLERNAVSYRTPLGEMKILVQDERIKWPDTFAIDANNNLFFTDSNLQETKVGKSVNGMTFKVYRVSSRERLSHERN